MSDRVFGIPKDTWEAASTEAQVHFYFRFHIYDENIVLKEEDLPMFKDPEAAPDLLRKATSQTASDVERRNVYCFDCEECKYCSFCVNCKNCVFCHGIHDTQDYVCNVSRSVWEGMSKEEKEEAFQKAMSNTDERWDPDVAHDLLIGGDIPLSERVSENLFERHDEDENQAEPTAEALGLGPSGDAEECEEESENENEDEEECEDEGEEEREEESENDDCIECEDCFNCQGCDYCEDCKQCFRCIDCISCEMCVCCVHCQYCRGVMNAEDGFCNLTIDGWKKLEYQKKIDTLKEFKVPEDEWDEFLNMQETGEED